MKKTIISFLAVVFAFAIILTASPPVAAETGKSIQTVNTVQVLTLGDIPISTVQFSRTIETGCLIRPKESAVSVVNNYGREHSRHIAATISGNASELFKPPDLRFSSFGFKNKARSAI